jgi:hypothetical protein
MFIAFSHELHEDVGPHIDRLYMDGKGRIHVVEIDLDGPIISLVYDPELHRVLWTDPAKGQISSVAVDGKSATCQIINFFHIGFQENDVFLHIYFIIFYIPNFCIMM